MEGATHNYKLNDTIVIADVDGPIRGNIIGVDSYSLEAVDGSNTSWLSYTVTSDMPPPYDRFWFVCWDQKDWILWLRTVVSCKLKEDSIVLNKSGLVKIIFSGEAGPSTPLAALIQYKEESKYYCYERFHQSGEMWFNGRKILEPEII